MSRYIKRVIKKALTCLRAGIITTWTQTESMEGMTDLGVQGRKSCMILSSRHLYLVGPEHYVLCKAKGAEYAVLIKIHLALLPCYINIFQAKCFY